LIPKGLTAIWRRYPGPDLMERLVLIRVRNGDGRRTQMQNCHRLRELRENAATARRRSRCLLDEAARLQAITGFSPDTVVDVIGRTLEARKRACAAFVSASAKILIVPIENSPTPDKGVKLTLA